MSKNNTTFILVGIAGAIFLYFRSNFGDAAANAMIFFFLGLATGIGLVNLGGRMNDNAQFAVIDLLKHTKGIVTPVVKSEARAQEALDKAAIRDYEREQRAAQQSAPKLNADQQALRDWMARNRPAGPHQSH